MYSKVSICRMEDCLLYTSYQVETVAQEDFFQAAGTLTVYFHFIKEVVLTFIGCFKHEMCIRDSLNTVRTKQKLYFNEKVR